MSVSVYLLERAQTRKPVLFWRIASWVLLLLVFSLSGCLLQRLYSIREQLCDFEQNFKIVTNEGVLKNNDEIVKRSQVDAYFNASGSQILRVRVSSLRYHLDADFVTGKAILKVRASKKSNI
jgi:hypothetical protein